MTSRKLILGRRRVTNIKGLVDFGLLLILLLFGVFGGWAISVPISGAIIAHGEVIKQGKNQEITHELGGVVADIKVKEGEHVNKGDVLVVLSGVERRSLRDRLRAKLAGLDIVWSRLVTEQKGLDSFKYVAGDIESGLKLGDVANSSEFETLIADQTRQFNARQNKREFDRSILESQKNSLKEELSGIDAEFKALKAQIASLQKEVKLRQEIHKEGYGRTADLRQFERQLAAANGDKARLQTRKHSLPFKITEITKRLETLDGEFQEKLSQEMSDVRREMVDVQNQFTAADNALNRILVKAPVAGLVDKIHVNAVGSAVAAFAPIAEIVPESEPVVVEVEVKPSDIDEIHVDQTARVVLSAFDSREVLPVGATTVFVSPDRRVHEQTGQSYFVARLEINPVEISKVPKILPGMPVEAYLDTAQRTFIEILFEPFTKSVRRSFRG